MAFLQHRSQHLESQDKLLVELFSVQFVAVKCLKEASCHVMCLLSLKSVVLSILQPFIPNSGVSAGKSVCLQIDFLCSMSYLLPVVRVGCAEFGFITNLKQDSVELQPAPGH